MAIQGVGGSKVYVITGSGRDPRLTSSGQSWANLVSQQKYRLWQEAQREALQDIQYERLDFESKQRIQQELKRRLNDDIQAAQSSIQKLKQAEVESQQAIKEMVAKEKNLRGRPVSVSGGAAGAARLSTDPIDKRLNQLRTQLRLYQGEVDTIDEQIADLSGVGGALREVNAGAIKQLEGKKDIYSTQVDQIAADMEDLSFLKEQEEPTLETPATRVQRRIGAAPIVSPGAIDYSEQIAELEAERARLQEQIQGIEAPTLERPDLIGRTREIYGEKFAPQRRAPSLPSPPPIQPTPVRPSRALEMDLLGMTPPTPEVKPEIKVAAPGMTPSEFVGAEYTRIVQDMNNTAKATKAMELIRDLSTYFSPASKDYEEARKAIISAYQKSINPKAAQVIEAGSSDTPVEIGAEQSRLVKSLYSPSQDMTPEKRQQLFDNAAVELKSHYQDSPTLDTSLSYLVQLHEGE
ncbi:MAG: hypothetical protein EBV86_08230 [Marivivens sp.]|nr:hypothetical protein [Marivivens sp.]